jgi:hypothetical protein
LQIAAIIKLRGIWRFLAILPLLPMAYVLIVTVIAFRQDLNLWPVLLIFAAPLALAYLIVVRIFRARTLRASALKRQAKTPKGSILQSDASLNIRAEP